MSETPILICGLRWPEPIRYYLLENRARCYELAIWREGEELQELVDGVKTDAVGPENTDLGCPLFTDGNVRSERETNPELHPIHLVPVPFRSAQATSRADRYFNVQLQGIRRVSGHYGGG